MAAKKKVVKSTNKGPRTLTTLEVSDVESRLHKISMLQKETELIKSAMEKIELKGKIFQLQAEVSAQSLKEQQRKLKEHGAKVLAAEKSSTEFIDGLREKYGIKGRLAYDPETFIVEEADSGEHS